MYPYPTKANIIGPTPLGYEPEIEGQCVLCDELEHRCECSICDCSPPVMHEYGDYCHECGGIVR